MVGLPSSPALPMAAATTIPAAPSCRKRMASVSERCVPPRERFSTRAPERRTALSAFK